MVRKLRQLGGRSPEEGVLSSKTQRQSERAGEPMQAPESSRIEHATLQKVEKVSRRYTFLLLRIF